MTHKLAFTFPLVFPSNVDKQSKHVISVNIVNNNKIAPLPLNCDIVIILYLKTFYCLKYYILLKIFHIAKNKNK